jgi:hypothetical protein
MEQAAKIFEFLLLIGIVLAIFSLESRVKKIIDNHANAMNTVRERVATELTILSSRIDVLEEFCNVTSTNLETLAATTVGTLTRLRDSIKTISEPTYGESPHDPESS